MRQSHHSQAFRLFLSHLMMSLGQVLLMTAARPKLIPIKIKNHRVMSLVLLGLLLAQPVIAHAENQDGNIVLAALTVTTPNDIGNTHDTLFGATEQRYTDLSAFTKWTGVLARFKKEFPASQNRPEVQAWLQFLSSVKDYTKQQKIEAVNQYMNRIAFISDQNNYGVADYWATPMEFLAKGGDCEDYAIAKYISLRALGFSSNELRLAIVYDRVMRMPHALLITYNNDQTEVLDNQNPDVVNADDINRYKPIYAISQAAWWRY
jgi:predicted transglutaminase-like cysteine proteinase